MAKHSSVSLNRSAIEKLAKSTQQLYLAQQYAEVLPQAQKLRQAATFPAFDAIVLTSHIWTIKSMMALHVDDLRDAILAYQSDARSKQHVQHQFQAAQFLLQYCLKCADYAGAITAMDETAAFLPDDQRNKLMLQAAEIEIATARFNDAQMRLDALLANETTANDVRANAHRLTFSLNQVLDANDVAQHHLDEYFTQIEACSHDPAELVEAMALKADVSLKHGHANEALQTRDAIQTLYGANATFDENALQNELSRAEILMAQLATHDALDLLDNVKKRIWSMDPDESKHIRRAYALTRCQLSLDVDNARLDPDTEFALLDQLMPSPFALENVAAQLSAVQHALLRKKYDGLSSQLDAIRNQCERLSLNAVLAPVDATHAELCWNLGDADRALMFAQRALARFTARQDMVASARVNARCLVITGDLTLADQLHAQITPFIDLGHRDIALTLALACADAQIRANNTDVAREHLDLAQTLIVPGTMTPRENRLDQLLNRL